MFNHAQITQAQRGDRDKDGIPVIIYGAGQNGRVVLDILRSQNSHTVVGFIDDNKALSHKNINGIPVLGDATTLDEIVRQKKINNAFVSIGNNITRAHKTQFMKELGFNLINVIHARAIISRDVKLGENIQIAPGVIINTGSSIGDNVILNTGATADHDNLICDNVQICPGVHMAGNVRVGAYALIGTGATIINNVRIGKNAVVGAGSVILKDVPDNAVVFGVPGVIRDHEHPHRTD